MGIEDVREVWQETKGKLHANREPHRVQDETIDKLTHKYTDDNTDNNANISTDRRKRLTLST